MPTAPATDGDIRRRYRITSAHDPMSHDYGLVITTLAARVNIVAILFPNVVTADAITGVYDWTLRVDPELPPATLVYMPGRLTIAARDTGEIEALLRYAQEAKNARRWLRTKVIEVAGTAGLSLRPFARPAGATR